jgi:hypothetical protein
VECDARATCHLVVLVLGLWVAIGDRRTLHSEAEHVDNLTPEKHSPGFDCSVNVSKDIRSAKSITFSLIGRV